MPAERSPVAPDLARDVGISRVAEPRDTRTAHKERLTTSSFRIQLRRKLTVARSVAPVELATVTWTLRAELVSV